MTGPRLPIVTYKHYLITVRNKFDTLQTSERHAPNDEYENFIIRLEAAIEWMPTKPRANLRVPWEPEAIREKQDNMK